MAVLAVKIDDRVSTEVAMAVTDKYESYRGLRETDQYRIINYSCDRTGGQVHTNTFENFWPLFKCRLVGSSHKVSVKLPQIFRGVHLSFQRVRR